MNDLNTGKDERGRPGRGRPVDALGVRMHDKSALFVKGNGFRLLQDGGGVEKVKCDIILCI